MATTEVEREFESVHAETRELEQMREAEVRQAAGAPGARALTHINEIAMEQARNRSPQS